MEKGKARSNHCCRYSEEGSLLDLLLFIVIIKGDPFNHGLVSMGDPTVQARLY